MKNIKFAVVTLIIVFGAMMLPQPVSAIPGSGVRVLSLTKTLPVGGGSVAFTLTAAGFDLIVTDILVDNSGTASAERDFDIVSVTIDGVEYRPGQLPENIGSTDDPAVRPLICIVWDCEGIPLKTGSKLVMNFETLNGVNDVKLKVTVGINGGGLVTTLN